MSSVITREELNDWIWVYESKNGFLDIDDIKMLSREINYQMNGRHWDYDLDDDCQMLIVYKEY